MPASAALHRARSRASGTGFDSLTHANLHAGDDTPRGHAHGRAGSPARSRPGVRDRRSARPTSCGRRTCRPLRPRSSARWRAGCRGPTSASALVIRCRIPILLEQRTSTTVESLDASSWKITARWSWLGGLHRTPTAIGASPFVEAGLDRQLTVHGARRDRAGPVPSRCRSSGTCTRYSEAPMPARPSCGSSEWARAVMHVEPVQRQHAGDPAEGAGDVAVDHDDPIVEGAHVVSIRSPSAPACRQSGNRVHVASSTAPPPNTWLDARDEVGDQFFLPRPPRRRSRRLRVGDRERRAGARAHPGRLRRRRRIGSSPDRRDRVARRHRAAAGGTRPSPPTRRRRGAATRGAARARAPAPSPASVWSPGIALAEVVEQRSQHEQVGAVRPMSTSSRGVGGRLPEVPVDREAVVGVALRA